MRPIQNILFRVGRQKAATAPFTQPMKLFHHLFNYLTPSVGPAWKFCFTSSALRTRL